MTWLTDSRMTWLTDSRITWMTEWPSNMSWDQLKNSHLFSLAAAGLAVIYVVNKIRQKKYRLPPGPRPLPILGNLLSLSSEVIYLTLTKMSKKYGEIFTLYLGTRCVVVLNNCHVIREAYLKKGVEFAGRPVTALFDAFGGADAISFGQYSNPRWQIQRKIAHRALRKFSVGKPLESLIHNSLTDICHLIDDENCQPFDPAPKLSLMAYNIIAAMVFGKTFEPDDPFFVYMTTENDKFNVTVGNGLLADIYPILRYLPNSVLKSAERLQTRIGNAAGVTWDEHLETYNPDELSDFMYLLISAKKEIEKEEGVEATSLLQDKHYLAIFKDFFFAGTDGLRLTLHWVVLFAAMYPEVQKKMQKEIDDVIGQERMVSLSDRPHLPYTEAVFRETMRMFPVLPVGFPRATSCDVEIRGYTLPKGTWVMPNIWGAHYDPYEWEKPDCFIPERHLDENGSLALKHNSFLSFSIGRRACLGESFSIVCLHLLVATLFQRYWFAPPDGVDLEVKTESGLEVIAQRYKIVAKPRV